MKVGIRFLLSFFEFMLAELNIMCYNIKEYVVNKRSSYGADK